MSTPWFYVETLPAVGASATLDASEAKHAAGSRRLAAGDAITVFDGRGGVADAVISTTPHAGRGAFVAQVRSAGAIPPPAPAIHLGCALPKGDRLSTLIGMATQLGIASFAPLKCERSIVGAGTGSAARWRRIMVESCKQSRRPHVPAIEGAASPEAFVRRRAAGGAVSLVAHPGGLTFAKAAAASAGGSAWSIAIGPEGGFTDQEVDAMKAAGAIAVSLGRSILRIETAAVAMIACLRIGRPGEP
jgi:16S rRNA (uracil1498-N3)-methyltransferase